MFRVIVFVLAMGPLAVAAASPEDLDALHKVLRTQDLIKIVSDEGLEQSEDLRNETFQGNAVIGWRRVATHIYDTDRLTLTFRENFDAAFKDADITPLIDFFGSETGAQIVEYEIEARRAISSEEVEQAAMLAFEDLVNEDAPRVGLLEKFAETNQLIDRNVAGALNANVAFFQGMSEGPNFAMTESQMLDFVWAREAEIRSETELWVFGYMAFAYKPLTDQQISDYIAFAATELGQDLNRAYYSGFDTVYRDASFALGQAIARFSLGDEL